MDLGDVSIATITRVHSPEEEGLIGRALARLAALGVPTAVADRGSSASFIACLERRRNITLVEPEGEGLVGQVHASVDRAVSTGRPIVLYTEPDKLDFFERHLAGFLRAAPAGEDAGVVIAARSQAAFETFPAFQRVTEQAANELCGIVTGCETDYFYGPFLFRRDLADYVRRATAAFGWGWRPYLFASASRRGSRVVPIAGDYVCPDGQRAETDADKEHRLRQLADNVRGLIAALL